ncbi:PaREP1 family protein [Sulfurisphaera javensis]|uniref:PaREP1 family protein n=1 Tax=Sulfurisphaera javensis TaxID=2049879 RepID=A0AAT9GTM0_9CREN
MNLLTASDVYLHEADEFLSKGDVVQASEKYYKAAEEALKLIAVKLNITDILEKIKSKRR